MVVHLKEVVQQRLANVARVFGNRSSPDRMTYGGVRLEKTTVFGQMNQVISDWMESERSEWTRLAGPACSEGRKIRGDLGIG